jgi:prepilin-type N-terminal cleavage/methylation domain-containing protein
MSAHRHNGYTLAEMLIVCAVLAVAAAVALPSAQPVAEFRVDAAASEVVQALRFARQEAMRTGAYRALRCDIASNQLSVYVPDASGGVANMVAHPLSKMDYTLNLGQAPAGSNMALTRCSFVFTDKSTNTFLAFDADGNPIGGTMQIRALSSGTIIVGAGNVTRTIAVDAIGRVTTS